MILLGRLVSLKESYEDELTKISVVSILTQLSRLGYRYFTKFWNILDILVILLSCICAGFNIYRTIRVNATLSDLLSNPNEYSNFERLSYWEMQFNYAIGVLVFLVWIKVSTWKQVLHSFHAH